VVPRQLTEFPINALVAAIFFLSAGSSHALTFTQSGVNAETGTELEATVSFELVGSQLEVTLENSGSGDVVAPVDILQAVYWDIADNVSLSLVSATTEMECEFPKSKTGTASCSPGGTYTTETNPDIGEMYAYNPDTAPPEVGIGSAGLGNFGGTGGMEWGILSAGDDLSTYNGGMTERMFVNNSTKFTLDISTTDGSTPTAVGDLGITKVAFNFGTSTNLLVPEPGTLALFPLAAAGVLVARRRRKRTP
jgi:hypothetical protein